MTRTTRRSVAECCATRGAGVAGRRPRRVAGLVVAAVAVLGLGSASAANLGVVSTSLAAGSAAVSSCQAGAPVSADLVSAWTTGAFRTTAVELDGIASGCVGQSYRLSVIGTAGQQLAEVTGQVQATSFTTGTFTAVTTSTIDHVEVVIHS